MEIYGRCNNCNKTFDAHWHNVDMSLQVSYMINPYCLYCKSNDIITTNDESNDYETITNEYEMEDD